MEWNKEVPWYSTDGTAYNIKDIQMVFVQNKQIIGEKKAQCFSV